jgi:hypothetical protein
MEGSQFDDTTEWILRRSKTLMGRPWFSLDLGGGVAGVRYRVFYQVEPEGPDVGWEGLSNTDWTDSVHVRQGRGSKRNIEIMRSFELKHA